MFSVVCLYSEGLLKELYLTLSVTVRVGQAGAT